MFYRRSYTLTALLWLLATPLSAETIAMIGTGSVSGALGPALAAKGHSVVYGSRKPNAPGAIALAERTAGAARVLSPAAAASRSDVIVLGVPGLVVESVVASLGDLKGKILIDPTNALVTDDDGRFRMDVESSNAELIQRAAPTASVVKAFNTINWRTMIDPSSAGGPVSVPLVGDDDDAKQRVAALVTDLGLEPIDLGPLHHARHVEGMLILWINNRFVDGKAFDYYLRPTEAP